MSFLSFIVFFLSDEGINLIFWRFHSHISAIAREKKILEKVDKQKRGRKSCPKRNRHDFYEILSSHKVGSQAEEEIKLICDHQ
jgi:hypothetical protein